MLFRFRCFIISCHPKFHFKANTLSHSNTDITQAIFDCNTEFSRTQSECTDKIPTPFLKMDAERYGGL